MPTIEINIQNKIARAAKEYKIVCGNSDYVILFSFDEEWQKHTVKTARFSYMQNMTKKHIDVVFENNECPAPVLSNIKIVEIGVFAGDLETTTPCMIECEKSILCDSGFPEDPPENVYNEIIQLCNEAVETAESVERRADAGEFDGAAGEKGEDGHTPERGVDYWTPEDVAAMQKYIGEEIAKIPTGGGDIVFSELANFTLEEDVSNFTVPLIDDAYNYRSLYIFVKTPSAISGQYYMRLRNLDTHKTLGIISHANEALKTSGKVYTKVDFFKNYCYSSYVQPVMYQWNSSTSRLFAYEIKRTNAANGINFEGMTFPTGTNVIVEAIL